MCVRRIGVALIPVLLYLAAFHPGLRLYVTQLSRRLKVAILLVAAAAGAAIAWAAFTTSTLRDFGGQLSGLTVIGAARGILIFRLKELGETALNLPYQALPPAMQAALPFVGTVVFLLVLAGIASRRRQFGVVEAYFLSYVAVLLVYPYYDPRYWLPVIPLLIAYCGVSLRRLVQAGIIRQLLTGYLLLFVVVGLVTLMLNTAVSFSGSRVAEVYPEYRPTYCAAWHCQEGFDAARVEPDGVRLLHDFQ
jgi:hypothetical protein